MQLSWLEYFVDLSETYSITNTARRFFISQQAVSNSIRSLEIELGVVLLTRSKKGVSFTSEGKEMLPYAKEIIRNYELMRSCAIVPSVEEAVYRNVIIYCSSVMGYIINPLLISIVEKNFSNVAIRGFFNENNSYNIIKMFLKEKCDICIITLNVLAYEEYKSSFEAEGISSSVLKEDSIVWCCNSSFRNQVDGTHLSEYSNICLLHLTELQSMSNYFLEQPAKSLVRTDDILSVQDMLRTVGTVAYMPRTTFEHFFSNSKFTAYCIPDVTLVHAVIFRKNADPIIHEIVRLIKGEAALL